jgi:hypothetical protein
MDIDTEAIRRNAPYGPTGTARLANASVINSLCDEIDRLREENQQLRDAWSRSQNRNRVAEAKLAEIRALCELVRTNDGDYLFIDTVLEMLEEVIDD